MCRPTGCDVTLAVMSWSDHRQTHEMAPGVNQETELLLFFFFHFLDKFQLTIFLAKQNYPCYDERLFQDVNWMPWLSA